MLCHVQYFSLHFIIIIIITGALWSGGRVCFFRAVLRVRKIEIYSFGQKTGMNALCGRHSVRKENCLHGFGLDSPGSGRSPAVGSVKSEESLGDLRNCELLKKESAVWSYVAFVIVVRD
jgi:hypothetical protein